PPKETPQIPKHARFRESHGHPAKIWPCFIFISLTLLSRHFVAAIGPRQLGSWRRRGLAGPCPPVFFARMQTHPVSADWSILRGCRNAADRGGALERGEASRRRYPGGGTGWLVVVPWRLIFPRSSSSRCSSPRSRA